MALFRLFGTGEGGHEIKEKNKKAHQQISYAHDSLHQGETNSLALLMKLSNKGHPTILRRMALSLNQGTFNF
jgi:hypothetical protein